jgi:PKD repeat protein
MREEIIELGERLRRRLRWMRGIDLFLEISFLVSVPVAVLLLLDRLLLETGWTGALLAPWTIPAMGAGIAFALSLAVAIALSQEISAGEIGLLADRSVQGEERFLSALEIAQAGGTVAFEAVLLRDAARLPIRPREIVPPPRIGYRWGTGIALAAAVLLELYPPLETSAPHAGFTMTTKGGPAPLEIECVTRHRGSVREIEWDFGEGEGKRGVRATHRYTRPGIHRVRQTVRGPGGISSVEKQVVVVAPGDPWAAFDASPEKGRVPLRVTFANRSRNGTAYEWDFGNGFSSREPDPEHLFEKPGRFVVRLWTSNARGRHQSEKTIRVVGPDAPLADFRAHPRKGPAPLAVSFEDLSTGKIESWGWDFGDEYAGDRKTSPETNPNHLFRFPGSYTILLRVRGPGGEEGEMKRAYIQVGDSGEDPQTGGGGGLNLPSRGGTPDKPEGGGKEEGRLFGKKTRPREIRIDPVLVTAPGKEGEETLRERWVWSGGKTSTGNRRPQSLEQLFPRYEAAVEKTVGRERVPPAVRTYVKRYFERIRPR